MNKSKTITFLKVQLGCDGLWHIPKPSPHPKYGGFVDWGL